MPRRTVQEVTVQDVQKRRNPNKHYVYIIKVSWSDGSTESIFRRYSKFFDLQMELLDKFPVEGGQKDPKRRIIPFLPGKILFRRSHIRDVAMKRLRPINEYCRALIQLPVYISQCEEVRVFFETRPEDINPPKEEPISKKKSGIVERATAFLNRGDSSAADPLLLDQYVAVTDYEKQESSEVSLHVGQVVEVIEKNESGWWFISSDDAQGWVPATCLEAQDDPDDFTIPGEEDEKYTVIYQYSARDQDEIDLERGMIVEVIQKNLEGWWKIRYQGLEGWAPASYLKKTDLQGQKQTAGAAAHASTNDLDGLSKQNQQNNAAKENQDNSQKENRLSFFSENKLKVGLRHRPPPRRDLTIPRGTNLPKPPVAPLVEEEFYTIADFQTTIPDGISFQAGIKVEVIEKNNGGWWYIQIDEKEGWAPATFIDKYKKTSNAVRPNFLAPLPNEMEKLRLENGGSSNVSGTDDSWSKPLPDEPTTAPDSCARPKLRDWKASANKVPPTLAGPLPPAPSAPPAEEKPALPPRRESINKSFDLEVSEKPRPDLSKPLPPKPQAPGVIMPLVPPKAAPFKPDKPPENKKEDKSKVLHLRNEMGLECGHKISAKEVKKFNLKPVPKQPPKPKVEAQEEKPDAAGPAVFMKPKPSIRPKPVPAAKPDPPAENKLDITNLRSKLRPSKPADPSSEANSQNGATTAEKSSHPSAPPSSPPHHIPTLSNGKHCDEPKLPPKHINGHRLEISPPPAKPAVPPHKEPPQRPPNMLPRRPPPPKKTDPSSPTESKPPPALREIQDHPKGPPPSLSRPPPPKPKGFMPPPPNKDKEEPKCNKVPVPPKPQLKPGPPKDKLPPLLMEPSKDELYLAVADFEGDDQTSSFKVGTVFEVMEKNSSGWWFCKNVGQEVETWIPSNYLSKKP
ncbi:LOW QUALITY PROTEIN: SH3 and PX domain-containing protein 2B [Trematomus bernacchii]|uniref:LOW QUALITY PROTEIN: SH3 and PX domain-containing protein 2B n=1 Tax=Trematomus bernacchii TaxID=40690 RepID=UPI00146E248D|nr:LOW QUALITY PROTEIN: SH3 and PX domain-containing protein 2B [Trematomus bernacchii]